MAIQYIGRGYTGRAGTNVFYNNITYFSDNVYVYDLGNATYNSVVVIKMSAGSLNVISSITLSTQKQDNVSHMVIDETNAKLLCAWLEVGPTYYPWFARIDLSSFTLQDRFATGTSSESTPISLSNVAYNIGGVDVITIYGMKTSGSLSCGTSTLTDYISKKINLYSAATGFENYLDIANEKYLGNTFLTPDGQYIYYCGHYDQPNRLRKHVFTACSAETNYVAQSQNTGFIPNALRIMENYNAGLLHVAGYDGSGNVRIYTFNASDLSTVNTYLANGSGNRGAVAINPYKTHAMLISNISGGVRLEYLNLSTYTVDDTLDYSGFNTPWNLFAAEFDENENLYILGTNGYVYKFSAPTVQPPPPSSAGSSTGLGAAGGSVAMLNERYRRRRQGG